MSNSFKSVNGKRTFGGFKESSSSSDYVNKKRIQQIFCNSDLKSKVVSQGDLQLLRRANFSKYYCPDAIDTTNLNINLITRLDLTGVSVIKNNITNASPTPIEAGSSSIVETILALIAAQFDPTLINGLTQSVPAYLQYTIDPSGALFGNTVCGLNNYTRFMTFEQTFPGYVSCLLPMDDELSWPEADNLFDVNTYAFTENGLNFKSAHLASLLGVTNDHFNWYDPVPYKLRQQGIEFNASSAIINVRNIENMPNKSYFYIQSSLGGIILTSGYIVVDTTSNPGLIIAAYEVADYNNIPPLPSFYE